MEEDGRRQTQLPPFSSFLPHDGPAIRVCGQKRMRLPYLRETAIPLHYDDQLANAVYTIIVYKLAIIENHKQA
jgi:hypothetical protein